MSEVPQLEHFNKKNGHPEMTNFFLYCIKKMSFSGSPKGTPHDWCRRTMTKRTILQWKPIELGGVPQKSQKDWWHIFTWDLYSMYVVLQGIGSLSLYKGLYKGIHYIRNSLWGVATRDVWSSSTRTFQPKKTGTPKWSNFFLYCI